MNREDAVLTLFKLVDSLEEYGSSKMEDNGIQPYDSTLSLRAFFYVPAKDCYMYRHHVVLDVPAVCAERKTTHLIYFVANNKRLVES